MAASASTTHLEGVSVVLRGQFNPAILSPAWLVLQDLISAEDSAEAKVEVISPQVAQFSTPWCTLQVLEDRLQVSTSEIEEFERVRDLAVGILLTLSHTPIAALGINRETHIQVKDVETWHKIGDTLTPKEVWSDALSLPGLKSLSIQGAREDDNAGEVIMQIEPSVRVVHGLYLSYNESFLLEKVPAIPRTRRDFFQIDPPRSIEQLSSPSKLRTATKILNEEWVNSMRQADRAFGRVRKMAKDLANAH